MEATSDDVVTWIIQRSQDTAAPAQVQFELQAIKTWRLHASKPLGYIPFETSVSKGLLNYVNPSHSGIKGFEPNQLQALIKQAIVQEKACNLASLRLIALYVLQFWGVARFVEVQDMQIGHLVHRVNHFEMVITRLGGSTPVKGSNSNLSYSNKISTDFLSSVHLILLL